MSNPIKQQIRAGVVALAPVVLAVGFLLHPYAGDFADTAEIAADVVSGPLRWAWAHILISLGVVLILLAVFAVRLHLRSAGEDTWSFLATGLITVGGGMLVALIGLEGLGGYAAAEAGGPVEAFYQAADDWTWLFLVTIIVSSLGLLALAAAVRSSGVLSDASTWVVVAAFVIGAISVIGAIAKFIPSSWATYITSVVAIVGFWTLAVSLWSSTETAVSASWHSHRRSHIVQRQ